MRVELSGLAEKQLAKIPLHIVKKFALWVDLVSVEGFGAARAIPGYRDHLLKGDGKVSSHSLERGIQSNLSGTPGWDDSPGLRRGGQQT